MASLDTLWDIVRNQTGGSMKIDIHIINATPVEAQRVLMGISFAEEILGKISPAIKIEKAQKPTPDLTCDEQTDCGPVPNGPVPTGPVPNGPVPNGPVPNGPVPTGPVPNGPVPTGPVPTGPVPTGPVPNGPVPNGPVPTGPVPTGPVPKPVKEKKIRANGPVKKGSD